MKTPLGLLKFLARASLAAVGGGPVGDFAAALLPARLPHFKVGDRPAGIGDWELEELLGVGGFGEVWKARNANLPDPVALKFCLDPQAAAVLRNEAALLGRVMHQGRHPGIVRL